MENLTDKELLDLAAKAAGISAYWTVGESIQQWPVFVVSCGGGMGTMTYEQEWNPLKNDVDAFRLAVKLILDIYFEPDGLEVCVVPGWHDEYICIREILGKYADKATRRAIVRCAAKIQIKKEEQK